MRSVYKDWLKNHVLPGFGDFVPIFMVSALSQVSDDSCGESELRENLCSGDDAFSQAYFVYVKKKGRSRGANRPQSADAVWIGVCLNSALTLLVLRVLADDHDTALALDDLALLADGLNGRSHFHDDITSYLHRIAPAAQPFG